MGPSQRSHGKRIIISAVINLKLSGKIPEGIKGMRCMKPFVILAVAAFRFSMMPGSKRTDSFMPNPCSFRVRWNKVNVSFPEVEKRLVNAMPLSVWTHAMGMGKRWIRCLMNRAYDQIIK